MKNGKKIKKYKNKKTKNRSYNLHLAAVERLMCICTTKRDFKITIHKKNYLFKEDKKGRQE